MKDKNLSQPQSETNSLSNKPGVKLVKGSFLSVTFNKLLALEYNNIMSKQIIKGKI